MPCLWRPWKAAYVMAGGKCGFSFFFIIIILIFINVVGKTRERWTGNIRRVLGGGETHELLLA